MSKCSDMVVSGGLPSEACLRDASRDIAHDFALLEHAWDGRGSRLGYTQWFLVARSIHDFFFIYQRRRLDRKEVKYADDVLAADFLPSGQWAAIAKALLKGEPPDWPDIKKAANKLAAHLTFSRADIRTGKQIVPSEPVHRFLTGVASVWLRHLPDERRVWFG